MGYYALKSAEGTVHATTEKDGRLTFLRFFSNLPTSDSWLARRKVRITHTEAFDILTNRAAA